MLDLSAPTALQYFSTLVQSDENLPLLEAVTSLAQDEYPDLDLQQMLNQVDRLCARLCKRTTASMPPLHKVQVLGQFFFGELGFAGNINDYYDPANSYLNEVMHTRRGIPISLAVLWLELAHGLGLRAEGVNFPGHFLLQVHVPEGRIVVDPFTGRSLTRSDLRERIDDLRVEGARLTPQSMPLSWYLQSASPRMILQRMLRNLQGIHQWNRDWSRLVGVQNRLIVLNPQAWREYRERGQALAELGQTESARADLSRYLLETRTAHDRDAVMERLNQLGGWLLEP